MRALLPLSRLTFAVVALLTFPTPGSAADTVVRGEVTDSATGQAIACRIYIEAEDGTWHFPKSEAKAGSAFEYRRQRKENPRSVEMHTTLSAHPFVVTLPPGKYTFTIERGKEYLTESRAVAVGKDALDLKFKLRRWVDMASLSR